MASWNRPACFLALTSPGRVDTLKSGVDGRHDILESSTHSEGTCLKVEPVLQHGCADPPVHFEFTRAREKRCITARAQHTARHAETNRHQLAAKAEAAAEPEAGL